jgi:hypothetical protein
LKPPKRKADDRLAQRRISEADRLALRAECDKLKPDGIPQAMWDELNDDLDRQDAVEFADLVKGIQEYEDEHPDEPREPATASKKATAKRTKPKSR